jgi:hypothetical protein
MLEGPESIAGFACSGPLGPVQPCHLVPAPPVRFQALVHEDDYKRTLTELLAAMAGPGPTRPSKRLAVTAPGSAPDVAVAHHDHNGFRFYEGTYNALVSTPCATA